MKRRTPLAIAIAVLSVCLHAQTASTVVTDPFAHAGASGGQHVVQDSSGALYLARLDGSIPNERHIALDRSFDGGLTWSNVLSSGINDAGSGSNSGVLTNVVSIAIDDQDRIHFHFARFSYPSYYNSYYRSFDTWTAQLSPLVDVHGTFGISNSARTAGCNIAVGPNGTIWLVAGSSSSWREQLLMSNMPYASNGMFTSVGIISQSASAQTTRLVVDAAGNPHCSYYENTGSGDYRHRSFDLATMTWNAHHTLGNLMAPNDYWGNLTCDLLGNTHILVNVDATGAGSPTILYYMVDAASVLSGPVVVASSTNAQFTGNNQYTTSIACEESTGDVYVAFRDFGSAGELALFFLPFGSMTPLSLGVLEPPASGVHEYYTPRIRGSLWPATNRTGADVHITWRRNVSPGPYDLRFVNFFGTNPQVPHVALSPSNIVTPGNSLVVDFIAPTHAGEIYVPVLSNTLGHGNIGAPLELRVIPDAGTNFYFNDPLAPVLFPLTPPGSYIGFLDASGLAQGGVNVPSFVPPNLNITVYCCFVTVNGLGIVSSSSHAAGFTIL
ncbi:MAG: hypothetical protein KDB53_13070 [Planctomycetes bacterium]|nr:hypothetical protein [Planctomycetota bacterium]